jgi:hypothetical protein
MTERLNNNVTIRTLAHDLGLNPQGDVVPQIVKFCQNRIKKMLAEMDCTQDAGGILSLAAAKLDTEFIDVSSAAEAFQLQQEFVTNGETGLAMLKKEFNDGVLGITVRRIKRMPFQRKYVSVINCYGRNLDRAYFTKWHELVHLLTLTDQTRLAFRRTHVACDKKDPEESLVDVVAGYLAFHPPLIKPFAKRVLSFELIEEIRAAAFPEASRLAAMIGIPKAWPHPAVLIKASLASKRAGSPRDKQLRATEVSVNQAAEDEGVCAIRHFRVPEGSIIHDVFSGKFPYAESVEDMEQWVSSDGSQWQGGAFVVRAVSIGDCVQAILTRT